MAEEPSSVPVPEEVRARARVVEQAAFNLAHARTDVALLVCYAELDAAMREFVQEVRRWKG